jgi:hypothetical protein
MLGSLTTKTRLPKISKSNNFKHFSSLVVIFSWESKLYQENHSKFHLKKENDQIDKVLGSVRIHNQQMDRDISRTKMFNKKDEEKKVRK